MSQDTSLSGETQATNLLQNCHAYQDSLPPVKAQVFRIEQAIKRQEQRSSTSADKRLLNMAKARTELDILEKNLNRFKSKARTAAIKFLGISLNELQENPPYSLHNLKQFHHSFSSLYLGLTEPGLNEQADVEKILENIWSHFQIILAESEEQPVNLEIENQTVTAFRQQKFHPLEKMALTRFHQILLQIRIKHHQTNAFTPQEADPIAFENPNPTFELLSPQLTTEEVEKQLHFIQRQLFQIQSQLRKPQLSEEQRQEKIQQRQQIKSKQALVYSQLRQLFIWQSLGTIQDFAERFSALQSQLKKAQNVNEAFSVSERGEYTQKRLNQELYQLYLDCRQAKIENIEIKSLDFIQNQQQKTQHLGTKEYLQHFQKHCELDQSLLTDIHAQPEIITAGESNNLEGLLTPLHGVLKQLSQFKQAV